MKKVKVHTIAQLAQKLREKHTELNSWPKASVACGVLTRDGRPNPGLAQRIALQSYNPARIETRERLGLPPVCSVCKQKVKRVRPISDWLTEAVGNLCRLEVAVNPALDMIRVYGRSGRRVIIAHSHIVQREQI